MRSPRGRLFHRAPKQRETEGQPTLRRAENARAQSPPSIQSQDVRSYVITSLPDKGSRGDGGGGGPRTAYLVSGSAPQPGHAPGLSESRIGQLCVTSPRGRDQRVRLHRCRLHSSGYGVSLGRGNAGLTGGREKGANAYFCGSSRFCHGGRGEGQEDLRAEVCPVPHGGEGGQAQDWSQPAWALRAQDGPGRGLHLHRRQQEQRHHLGRRYLDGVPGESQEVHPGHKDDLRRHQEEGRKGRLDSLPQEGHQ